MLIPQGASSQQTNLLGRLLSVKVLMTGLSLLLITLTAAILLSVTFTFSLEAATDIAIQHARVISSKAKGDIEAYLNGPVAHISSWQYSLAKGNVPFPSDEPVYPDPGWSSQWLERLVGPLAASDFTYQYTIFGFDDGNAMLCVTYSDSVTFRCQVYTWGSRDVNNVTQYSNVTNTDYTKANYTEVYSGWAPDVYNARTRTWYKQGTTAPGHMAWSNAFLSTVPTYPCICLSAGIYNGSGTFLGVGSIFLNLDTMAAVLSAQLTIQNTVSFLIDNGGFLLASTHPAPVSTTTNWTGNASAPIPSNCLRSDVANGASRSILMCREQAATYAYAPLRELAGAHSDYVATGDSSGGGIRKYRLDGRNYFVSVVPIASTSASGMGWRFAMFLPEDEITDGIIRGRDIAIYICIAVVVVAGVMCLVAVGVLLRPLATVADRMYRAAMMQDVDERDEGNAKSHLYEIATIQSAFNTMTSELAKIKSFLPQSVLEQLYGGSSEGDEDDEGDMESVLMVARASHDRRSQHTSHSSRGSQEPSSAHASTIQTKSSGGLCKPSLNTSVHLANRKVTMLSMNVLCFDHFVLSHSANDVVRNHGHIVKIVSDACAEFRGVMDGFQGDRFLLSFNAVTHAGSHATLAAHAAQAVMGAVCSQNGAFVGMSSGIASGPALVGNMGSATTKRFTVLSRVVSSAILLERLCKRYSLEDSATLVGGSACQDLDAVFELLTLDSVHLPATAKGKAKRTRVCAIMGVKESSADEWMYEMQEGSQRSVCGAINNAFVAFLDGGEINLVNGFLDSSANPSNEDARELPMLAQRVVSRLRELIGLAQAADSTEDFCRTYVNPLVDYYDKCAMPSPSLAPM